MRHFHRKSDLKLHLSCTLQWEDLKTVCHNRFLFEFSTQGMHSSVSSGMDISSVKIEKLSYLE